MTAATEPVGVSQVFLRPPMETLFKDLYFVSGSCIAKSFKDPALQVVGCFSARYSRSQLTEPEGTLCSSLPKSFRLRIKLKYRIKSER